tara:strand:- start:1961 stop:2251 length:291 start_codon:yes stop_codon:yes gene_type:complete
MHYVTTKDGRLGVVIEHCLVDLQAASLALDIVLLYSNIWALSDDSQSAQQEVDRLAQIVFEQQIACLDYAPALVAPPYPTCTETSFVWAKTTPITP